MSNGLYRTGNSCLTDDQLLLLDIAFRAGVPRRMLSREGYRIHFNLGYTHELDDTQLDLSLQRLCEEEILSLDRSRDVIYWITRKGGEVWSEERCPVWDRFCVGRHSTSSRGTSWQQVVVGSASVRDDFLRIWPEYLVRTRSATITNPPLLGWRSFPIGYVGIAVYSEPKFTPETYRELLDHQRLHWEKIERERTWWWDVRDLQKFVPSQS